MYNKSNVVLVLFLILFGAKYRKMVINNREISFRIICANKKIKTTTFNVFAFSIGFDSVISSSGSEQCRFEAVSSY